MQSRLESVIESLANIGSGFVLSSLMWEFVVKPVWNIETSVAQNLQITSLFTIVSVFRSYAWRRIGNWFVIRRMS